MRVAVCISGQTRLSSGCFESLYDKVLSRFPCDVFVHYWGDKPLDYICDNYQPTECRFDPQIDFTSMTAKREGLFAHGWSSFASASMFYSMREANHLKQRHERKNGFIYDFVVRTRFDVEVLSFFEQLPSDSSQLYVASNIKEPAPPFFSDIFWLTGSRQDDIACGVFSRYEEVADSVTVGGRITCNEEILYKHIDGRVVGNFSHQVQARIVRG